MPGWLTLLQFFPPNGGRICEFIQKESREWNESLLIYFGKLDSMTAVTMQAMLTSVSRLCQIWWEQNLVYFVSSVPLCSGARTVQAYLPAFLPFLLFCLSYCTAISTFWVTELIVPAHAFSADSIIRHSGHPEKKGGWEKKDENWKCGRVKKKKKWKGKK